MSFGFLWLNLALVALRFSFRECSDTSALDKTCNLNRSTTISEMDPTANEVATLKNQMNPNNRAHFDPSAQQLNLSVEVSIWGGVNKTDQREVDLNRRKPFRRRLETINSTSSSEDFVSCLQFKSGQSEIDDTVLNRTHADNFGSDLESRVNEKTTNKALNETCCDDVSSYLETGNQKFEQENFIAVNKSCCSMNVSSNNIEIRKIDDSLNLNQIMNESCCSDITSSNPKFFKSQDTNLLPGVDDSNQTQWSEINGDKINEELIFPLVPSPKTEQRVPQEKRSRFLETRELSRLKTMNQVTLEQQIQGSFEEPHKNRTNLNATRDIPEIQPKTFIGPLVNGTSVNLTGSPNNARTIKHYEKMVFDGQNLNQTEIRSVSERNDQSFSSDKKLLQDSIYGVSTNENVSYFIHENSPQKLVHSVSKNETNPFLNLKHVREKISPTITSRYNELSKRTLVQNISSENEEPFLSDESSKRKSSNSQRALAERGGNIDSFERSDLQWPVKRSAEIMGDLILGGLMMVHEREDTEACGPVMPQGGIQALETMLYTLDKINAATDLFKVSLGAHILDDCDKDTYGLEMALDFIKGKIK